MELINNQNKNIILATKLLPPDLLDNLVERPELQARLEQSLRNHRLTILNAPAGYGKTTLVGQWLFENSHKTAPARVGWLTLDASNNYWKNFWRYFMEACQKIWPEYPFEAAEMLVDGRPLPEVLAYFLNELSELPGRGVLVLEDFHRIVTPDIHSHLGFLVDHLPRQLRILLLTRQDPALPLARWRTNGDLYTLSADDLRFNLNNTQKYSCKNLAVTVSPEIVQLLQEKTGGWPAGVALAVQSAQGLEVEEAEQFLADLKGDYPPIRDFIINEILKNQTEKNKEFLLKTAFLDRLNPALAEAVTGMAGCDLRLEELVAAKMFLTRETSGEKEYVYREFFAAALRYQARCEFGETALKELTVRAENWYIQKGLMEEAIDIAFQAGDFERMGNLLVEFNSGNKMFPDIFRVRHWFEHMPESVWQSRPILCFNFAVVLLFTSDRAQPTTRLRVEIPLQMAEKAWRAEENWPSLGALLVFRSCIVWFQGDYRQGLGYITQALEWLPEEEIFWRGIGLCNLVPHELFEGHLNSAMYLVREALRICTLSNNGYSKRAGLAMLAEIYRQQLEFDQAIQIYNQIIEEAAQDPSDRSQTMFNLAQICFYRNDLDTAARYAEQALEGGRESGDDLLQIKASLLLIRLKNLRGEPGQAEKLVQMLVARTQNWPLLLREVEAYQAQLAIARGDLKKARLWSVMLGSIPVEGPRTLLETEALVQARLLIAQNNFELAQTLLTKWLFEAQEQGRAASECEIWFLKARAAFGEGDNTRATMALQQALTLAQPENFCLPFLEEGPGLDGFFQALLPGITDPALLAFGRSLLRDQRLPEVPAIIRHPALALAPGTVVTLTEPLSRQEQRVLRLLSEGLSNSEIADELVVSVNTVKSQVKSIYRKLDINSRREARQFAIQTLSA